MTLCLLVFVLAADSQWILRLLRLPLRPRNIPNDRICSYHPLVSLMSADVLPPRRSSASFDSPASCGNLVGISNLGMLWLCVKNPTSLLDIVNHFGALLRHWKRQIVLAI